MRPSICTLRSLKLLYFASERPALVLAANLNWAQIIKHITAMGFQDFYDEGGWKNVLGMGEGSGEESDEDPDDAESDFEPSEEEEDDIDESEDEVASHARTNHRESTAYLEGAHAKRCLGAIPPPWRARQYEDEVDSEEDEEDGDDELDSDESEGKDFDEVHKSGTQPLTWLPCDEVSCVRTSLMAVGGSGRARRPKA